MGFRGLYLVSVLSDLPFAALALFLLRGEWQALGRSAPALVEPAQPPDTARA